MSVGFTHVVCSKFFTFYCYTYSIIEDIMIYLPIVLKTNIRVVSSFLLKITLVKQLHALSVPSTHLSGVHTQEQLLRRAHMCRAVGSRYTTSAQWLHHHCPQQSTSVPLALHSHQHLEMPFFLTVAILVGFSFL